MRKLARGARPGETRDEVRALVATDRLADAVEPAEKAKHEAEPPSYEDARRDFLAAIALREASRWAYVALGKASRPAAERVAERPIAGYIARSPESVPHGTEMA